MYYHNKVSLFSPIVLITSYCVRSSTHLCFYNSSMADEWLPPQQSSQQQCLSAPHLCFYNSSMADEWLPPQQSSQQQCLSAPSHDPAGPKNTHHNVFKKAIVSKRITKKVFRIFRYTGGQCCGSGSGCFWASRIRISHYFYGSGSFHQQAKKKVRKTLISSILWLLFYFNLQYENWFKMYRYLQKVKSKKLGKKTIFCWHLVSHWRKKQGPRIRIGSVPKCHGSTTPQVAFSECFLQCFGPGFSVSVYGTGPDSSPTHCFFYSKFLLLTYFSAGIRNLGSGMESSDPG